DQTYCYHCRTHHPRNEMRLIVTKTGKRWRCIRSIEATRQGAAAREAYGRQISEINKAEGEKQAEILRAEGLAQARVRVAEAEAKAITLVTDALKNKESDPVKYLIAVRYIETLSEMVSGKDNKTIYMPFEATGVLSSLGGIKDILSK
ncbi:MAG TPA: SPFH/Band 7/PHB domain protein, partial [Bacteroidales bacterium]|nr:SPFH/Band 7/PHB domain protein [Bacteroidales bacterium]